MEPSLDGQQPGRPLLRRETTPARMMGQPQGVRDSSQQYHAPLYLPPDVRDGGQVLSYYPPYYPGNPQPVPVFYQPPPIQLINPQLQHGVNGSSLTGASMTPMHGAPLPSINNNPGEEAGTSRSRRHSRADSDGSSRSSSVATSAPGGHRPPPEGNGMPQILRPREPETYVRREPYYGYGNGLSRNLPPQGPMGNVPGPEDLEDGDLSTVYAFNPSRVSPSASQDSTTHDEDVSLNDEGDVYGSSAIQPIVSDRVPDISHVFTSQYDGDHTLGRSHGVSLAATLGGTPKHQPLFRWQHCHQRVMAFDHFSGIAANIPNLTVAEKRGVRDLLVRVRRKFVKTVQTESGKPVRHMEPATIQHVLPRDNSSKTTTFANRTVTWMCIPYFTLEPYSGLEEAADDPSAFPIETLLQAKFSRSSKKRDMHQAICEDTEAPAGTCFHIAQIWCLVVDNSFLLTYGAIKKEQLCGDTIRVSLEPHRDADAARQQAAINVAFGRSVLWTIPLDQCQTWPDFSSHFWEFWPQHLLFFRHKKPVRGRDWPRIWNLAKHASKNITIEVQLGSRPAPPPTGVLVPKNSRQNEGEDVDTNTAAGGSGSPSPPTLSIFSCLPGVASSDSDTIDEDTLDDHFREVEDYLLQATTFSDRRAYSACPEATRGDVHDYLEKVGEKLSKSNEGGRRESQEIYETQLDIFNAADVVCKFFFQPDVEVPTVGRFWGALKMIMTNGRPVFSSAGGEQTVDQQLPQANIYMPKARSELRRLCVKVQSFNETFYGLEKPEKARIDVSREAFNAWIHLLMSLIYLPVNNERSDRLLYDAKALVSSTITSIVLSRSNKTLLDLSVVLPLEIVSLFSLTLLQDEVEGPLDITKCYAESLDKIEAEISSKTPDRSQEHRISLLEEEIGVVQKTIRCQAFLFGSLMRFTHEASNIERPGGLKETQTPMAFVPPPSNMHSQLQSQRTAYPTFNGGEEDNYAYATPRVGPSYMVDNSWRSNQHAENQETPAYAMTGNYYGEAAMSVGNMPGDFRLEPTDSGGYRTLLIKECVDLLERKGRDFKDFHDQAVNLGRLNRRKIDTSKDRHEKAIYVFTIVTIVFLPMSAVASIFGMNTRDVRDMEHSQWAYWAAAIPVTALVIILGLLWTGEMGNFFRWARSLRPGSGRPNRVVVNMVPDDDESQGRGSPTMRQAPSSPMMVPRRPAGPSLGTFYNPGEIGGPGAFGAGARSPQAAGGGGNSELQKYQMQLLLLEQQNKRRLMMARQEQESRNGQS